MSKAGTLRGLCTHNFSLLHLRVKAPADVLGHEVPLILYKTHRINLAASRILKVVTSAAKSYSVKYGSFFFGITSCLGRLEAVLEAGGHSFFGI